MPKIRTPSQPAPEPTAAPVHAAQDPADAIITEELREQMTASPPELIDQLRNAAYTTARIRAEESKLDKRKKVAQASFSQALASLRDAGSQVSTVPIVDPTDHLPRFAYWRVDEILEVDVQALREGMFEYFHMVGKEDEELALVHASDVVDPLLKPPAVTTQAFKDACAAGVIPAEVKAACSSTTPKSGYVAFEKPKE